MSPYLRALSICCLCWIIQAAELVQDSQTGNTECPDACIEDETNSQERDRKLCGPESYQYRSIDGRCNNLNHPYWGKSCSGAKRILPPVYQDGVNYPRVRGKSGNVLNGSRAISRVISPEHSVSTNLSFLSAAFGQFMCHDMVKFQQPSVILCCNGDLDPALKVENGGPCFPVEIDDEEDYFTNHKCIEFLRSVACKQQPREQINKYTSFLDASTVYSATEEDLERLRGPNGKILVTENNMLPPSRDGNCILQDNSTDYCLTAGHSDVNAWAGLGVLHTIFVRYHNQIADRLSRYNPSWDSEKVFKESHKIVVGVLQHIAYSEYLPTVLDEVTLTKYNLKPGSYEYKEDVNPQMSHAFGVAAFRFGHSQIPSLIHVGQDYYNLENTILSPHLVLTRFEETMKGLTLYPAEAVDSYYSRALTRKLLETNATARNGIDLFAINIQRGRDHGIPPFNDFRRECGLPAIESFDSELLLENNQLWRVYEDVDDIDFYVGGILEKPNPGSAVGPSFACIIGRTFHDIKFGDRFFYEAAPPGGFSPDQLEEIKSIKLSSVICATVDVQSVQADVLYMPHPVNNPLTACSSMKQIDLSQWKDLIRSAS